MQNQVLNSHNHSQLTKKQNFKWIYGNRILKCDRHWGRDWSSLGGREEKQTQSSKSFFLRLKSPLLLWFVVWEKQWKQNLERNIKF